MKMATCSSMLPALVREKIKIKHDLFDNFSCTVSQTLAITKMVENNSLDNLFQE